MTICVYMQSLFFVDAHLYRCTFYISQVAQQLWLITATMTLHQSVCLSQINMNQYNYLKHA